MNDAISAGRPRCPISAPPYRWQDVAHYTQIIWRGTRSVGCALAEGRSFDYLVCRYYPAGNMFGMGPLDAAPVLAGGEE
ncbi:CAP domain-containing protein [Sphingobium scionense]